MCKYYVKLSVLVPIYSSKKTFLMLFHITPRSCTVLKTERKKKKKKKEKKEGKKKKKELREKKNLFDAAPHNPKILYGIENYSVHVINGDDVIFCSAHGRIGKILDHSFQERYASFWVQRFYIFLNIRKEAKRRNYKIK